MSRKISLTILIIVCFVLQTTVVKAAALAGTTPNLLLIITSCFGFMRGKKEGLYVGFFCGILVDVFFGGGILGINAFIYMLMGYINGYFHRVFYPEDVKLPLVFVAISDLTYSIITFIMFFLLRTRMNFFSYLRQIIIPEVVYTVLVTILFYRLILKLNMALEKAEREKEAKFA